VGPRYRKDTLPVNTAHYITDFTHAGWHTSSPAISLKEPDSSTFHSRKAWWV
jgi:hypothetical protein